MQENVKQLSPQERIQRATNALNQPVVCPDCGSTWFFEVTFNQYSKSVYSNAVGGDLKIISVMPQQLRMCPCGRPIAPNLGGIRGGRTPNAELASFFESLAGALEYRKSLEEGTKATQKLVNVFATREDVENLKAETAPQVAAGEVKEVAELRARIEALETTIKNLTASDAPKSRKTGKA